MPKADKCEILFTEQTLAVCQTTTELKGALLLQCCVFLLLKTFLFFKYLCADIHSFIHEINFHYFAKLPWARKRVSKEKWETKKQR